MIACQSMVMYAVYSSQNETNAYLQRGKLEPNQIHASTCSQTLLCARRGMGKKCMAAATKRNFVQCMQDYACCKAGL